MQSYYRYHGRKKSGFRKILKGILILFLMMAVLLFAATLFLQRYLVYGDDGVRLELPWSEPVEDLPEPTPSVSPTPPPIIKEEVEEEALPTPEPPDPTPVFHAVRLSMDSLLNDSLASEVKAAGADAVILTMKESNGNLNYVSANEMAIAIGASAAEPGLNDAIRALTGQEDIYTVAEVVCFRDQRLPTARSELRLQTNSGYCWDDHQDVRWSSPASQEVRDYLTALCVELAELGFDEILLTNCGFPTAEEGNLGWIKEGEAYPKGMLDWVITPFLGQIQTALEPYEVNLSVRTQAAELKGESANTGLTLENVLASCDRLWVAQEEWTVCAMAVLAADGELDPDRTVVAIQTEPGTGEASWAVMN